jgi:hypothetical protein
MSDLNVVSPSQLFVFQDVHPSSICMPAFMMYLPGGTVDGFYHYPSSLHRGSGVINFADGHMETRKWQDPADDQTRQLGDPGALGSFAAQRGYRLAAGAHDLSPDGPGAVALMARAQALRLSRASGKTTSSRPPRAQTMAAPVGRSNGRTRRGQSRCRGSQTTNPTRHDGGVYRPAGWRRPPA